MKANLREIVPEWYTRRLQKERTENGTKILPKS